MSNVSISIVSIDREVLSELDQGAKIHSVFKSVINLETRSGLITCGYALSPGKHRIVFGAPFPFLENFRTGQDVHATDDALIIGNRIFKINRESIHTFRPFTRLGTLEPFPKRFLRHIEILVGHRMDTFLDPQTEKILNRFKRFLDHTEHENINLLIGAGIGLTPIGDDFLMGYCLAEKALHGSVTGEARILSQLENTNMISAQQIRDVIAGHWTRFLRRLLEDLLIHHDDTSSRTMLEYGASSGAAIMYGLNETLKRRLTYESSQNTEGYLLRFGQSDEPDCETEKRTSHE